MTAIEWFRFIWGRTKFNNLTRFVLMTIMVAAEKIIDGAVRHPKPADSVFTYGTAGFRMAANLLDPVMYAVGLLAVLRSKKLNGKHIGVMITASHNGPLDNGVKLVEPLGEMLIPSWEIHAIRLANASSGQDLVECVNSIIAEEKIDMEQSANVVVGRDTR